MSPTGVLSQILSGELAGRALPSLHVGSSTELSESSLQPKAAPVPFPVAGLCSLPIHVLWGNCGLGKSWFGEVVDGHHPGQHECESGTDAVTPRGLCWSLCSIGM